MPLPAGLQTVTATDQRQHPDGGPMRGRVATAAPTAGQWMSFEIDVTATQVTVRRTDVDPDVALTVDNIAYRGGYLHLSTGSVDSLANKPHWRNIEIITV